MHQRSKRTSGEIGARLKREIGEALKACRQGRGDTLAAAAKEMKMEPKAHSASGGKASVFNIEDGQVFLPWKRVVSYAKYTSMDPAAVLIALAAAKALSDIDDKQERERLQSLLLERLKLDSLSELLRIQDQSSIEAVRERVNFPRRFHFWHDFGDHFPATKELTFLLAPLQGAYAENALEEILDRKDEQRIVIQDDGAEGVELTIMSYLDAHRRSFPVYIDAAEIRQPTLANYIKQQIKHLPVQLSEIADTLFLVIYNLPSEDAALRNLTAEVGGIINDHPKARVIFLSQECAASRLETLAANSFLMVPISRRASLGFVRESLKAIAGSSTELLEDWAYLAIRHALWLGIVCRFLETTNAIPSKWTMIRTGATILTYGVSSDSLTSSLLFDAVLDQKSADVHLSSLVQRLASAARSSMGSSPENRPFWQLDFSAREMKNLGGPLVEYVSGKGWRFTSTWVQCYFAALDYLRKIEKSTNKKRAVESVVGSLSELFDEGEYQKIKAREILSALAYEAQNYRPSISELIHKQLESLNNGLSRWVITLPNGRESASRFSFSRTKDSITYLKVLVEDQDPGFFLRRLAYRGELQKPSQPDKKDAMVVEIDLSPYRPLTETIASLAASEDVKPDQADVIVCTHFSLAWALRDRAVEMTSLEVPSLSRLGFLANHFCKNNGKWFGVPVQYPTKYLCYRKKVIGSPPTSLAELYLTLRKHKDQRGRPILGLQCKPGRPSLYYEWLAFVVALGGGDIVWTEVLGRGEVILDSAMTISATIDFLRIFMQAHPNSREWDWNSVVTAMEKAEVDMCLPFSDTIPELNGKVRDGELSYAPFRLSESLSSPYVSNRLVGLCGAPLHIFTGHIMVALNHDEAMKIREFRFMEWFLRHDIQREFAVWTKQLPVLDTEEPETLTESDGEFSSRVAREYAYLPIQDEFASPSDQLSQYQMIVLNAISGLIKRTERGLPSADDVGSILKKAASELRRQLPG